MNSVKRNTIRHPILLIIGLMLAGIGVLVFQMTANGKLESFSASHFGLDRLALRQDSWGAMRRAYTWFSKPHQGLLYQQIFFQQHIKFQYPPSSILIFFLADTLHFDLTNVILNCISGIFLGIECAAVGVLAYQVANRRGWVEDKLAWRLGATAIAILCLSFYPTHRSYSVGQVQTWINAWFVVACLCWFNGRRFLAGLLIGAVCIFKPQFGLFIIWAALRGQKPFLAGWAVVVVPIEGISVKVFGIANNLDYLAALRFITRHGEAFYANQSFNGMLNRMLGTGDYLLFEKNSFPSQNSIVYLGTIISAAFLIGCVMLFKLFTKPVNVIDFVLAGFTFTLASPIAWEHHYGFMPAVLVLLAMTLAAMPRSRLTIALATIFVVCAVLTAVYIPPERLAILGFGQVFQSYLLIGALGLLGLLYCLRDRFSSYFEPVPEETPAG